MKPDCKDTILFVDIQISLKEKIKTLKEKISISSFPFFGCFCLIFFLKNIVYIGIREEERWAKDEKIVVTTYVHRGSELLHFHSQKTKKHK